MWPFKSGPKVPKPLKPPKHEYASTRLVERTSLPLIETEYSRVCRQCGEMDHGYLTGAWNLAVLNRKYQP